MFTPLLIKTFICSSHRIEHKLELNPGTYNIRVKAKNNEGWSIYSDQATVVVQDERKLFFLSFLSSNNIKT